MTVLIVVPPSRASHSGNRVTARRWSRMLRNLGHRVYLREQLRHETADVLVALHARKSHSAIMDFRRRFPQRPIVVVISGTDLYCDELANPQVAQSIQVADRLVVLQPASATLLPRGVRDRVRVIYQSAAAPEGQVAPLKTAVEFCVVGHLRPVKDPFLAATAARQLPADSRIRITHLGAALSQSMERRARSEMQHNSRYRWLGARPQWQVRRYLSRCRALVQTSRSEGGPNVICEALSAGCPVLSTAIDGVIGMLGEDYPGYFPVGDREALMELLLRCEQDRTYYRALHQSALRLRKLFTPQREQAAWARLLRELR